MLNELQASYGPQGFQILAISDEEADVIRDFVKDHEVEYLNLVGTEEVVEAFGVLGLPAAYLVDGEGRVVESFLGPKPRRVLVEKIESLLAAQAASIREKDDYLAWEFFDWHAVRTAAWKATWIREPFGNGDWQLFDMAADPGESNDLAAEHPEVIQELADQWDVYADEVGIVPREVSDWPDQ